MTKFLFLVVRLVLGTRTALIGLVANLEAVEAVLEGSKHGFLLRRDRSSGQG